MNDRPPFVIAEAVTEFTFRGQHYRVLGWEDYVRKDGELSRRASLLSWCADCGTPFGLQTPRLIRWINRRCRDCAAPGRWVLSPCQCPTCQGKHIAGHIMPLVAAHRLECR